MQENDLKIDIFRYWFMFSDIDCAFRIVMEELNDESSQ